MTHVDLRALDARVRLVVPDTLGGLFADVFQDIVDGDVAESDAGPLEIVWRGLADGGWQIAREISGEEVGSDVCTQRCAIGEANDAAVFGEFHRSSEPRPWVMPAGHLGDERCRGGA